MDKEKSKKKTKIRFKRILAILVFGVSLYMIYNLIQSIQKTLEIQYDISSMKAQREKLLEEKNSIYNEIDKLSDEEYITRYARDNYIFTREGESVVVLPTIEE